MNSTVRQTWIPMDRISNIIQLEQALLLLILAIGVYFFYKMFLRKVSRERHQNLKVLFANLTVHILFGAFLFLSFEFLQWFQDTPEPIGRIVPYLGLLALVSWATIFVKIARIFIFEYLFIGHMKEGVPLLLVNICTLLISVALAAWIASDIFGVRLTPVLATSAIFSIVLGLALQDTLGNLFAGVALQLDKPYEIGDWIEVQPTEKKWVGQVLEITWRSTVLLSFTDELITIPNRLMSQAQVSNFSPHARPIIRSQIFRIPFGQNLEQAKRILVSSASSVHQILPLPEPVALITDTTESWVALKLIYYIHNYGAQYTIADEVYSKVIASFEAQGFELAPPRLAVVTRQAN
jgi:small-conductance mechanosensitive channel